MFAYIRRRAFLDLKLELRWVMGIHNHNNENVVREPNFDWNCAGKRFRARMNRMTDKKIKQRGVLRLITEVAKPCQKFLFLVDLWRMSGFLFFFLFCRVYRDSHQNLRGKTKKKKGDKKEVNKKRFRKRDLRNLLPSWWTIQVTSA